MPCPVNLMKPLDVPEAPQYIKQTREFMISEIMPFIN